MLRSVKHVFGYRLQAVDQQSIGKVHDFLFDDVHWTVRYLVADTRKWLPGRRVLISPLALGKPDWGTRELAVHLTPQQIEQSPPISADEPVSRQREQELVKYYGWPMYWGIGAGVVGGVPATARAVAKAEDEAGLAEGREERGDPHLRSVREVTNYAIAATDGEIGHVEDFIVDDQAWVMRYLVVDTRNWVPGSRKVLVAPGWIKEIDWRARRVTLVLAREEIRNSPEYQPGEPINRAYEVKLYDFYGRPVYWKETE